MPFRPGKVKTGGRRKGVVNRLTGTFRDAVQVAYNDVGGHEAFTRWAKKHPTEFYKIAARLIPVEIRDYSDKVVNVIIRRDPPTPVPEAVPAIEYRETNKDTDRR